MSSPSQSSWPLFHLPAETTTENQPCTSSASDESIDNQNKSGDKENEEDKKLEKIYSDNLKRWPEAPPWRRFLKEDQIDKKNDENYWKDLLRIQRNDKNSERRGESFRLGSGLSRSEESGLSRSEKENSQRERFERERFERDSQVLLQSVNAAIHLRRPLLVRGGPGTGKTSLAYALAHRLQLGPVLHWRITSRTRLVDGLYRYDALGLLQDLQRDDFQLRRQAQIQSQVDASVANPPAIPAERQIANYISLGPVGTAFLPSLLPRVLLIDEIDKADPQLPNELLHLFEEGEFDIPELTRERQHQQPDPQQPDPPPGQGVKPWELATADLLPLKGEDSTDNKASESGVDPQRVQPKSVQVNRVPVRCCQFPIVVMTSNDERDFSPAFKRRCLRISMPYPDSAQLMTILRSHFTCIGENFWSSHKEKLVDLIDEFKQPGQGERHDRATDQLLNYLHLFSEDPKGRPPYEVLQQLKPILLKELGASEGK